MLKTNLDTKPFIATNTLDGLRKKWLGYTLQIIYTIDHYFDSTNCQKIEKEYFSVMRPNTKP